MLTGRCNFSELKKTDVLRIVDRSTALSLKDDPIAIERLIRHNREAEINHFVSLVRQKVEKDTNHFAAMDLDFIDKDWLTTNGTFKIKLNDSLTQTENVRELDLLKQGKSIHETGAPFRTAGQRFMIKREPSVHILPKTTGNLSMLKEVSKDEMRVESNQEIKTDHPLSIPPPKVIRFLNPSAYDGQKEIKRMEEQFSLILDKLKSPKLVMKLPEGTVVPNRHLTDFYFVKKMHPKLRNTELKLSTNESIEDMVDNKSALLDVLEFDESHPIEEASGVEEETIKYGSEDYKNNPNDKGKKKKWVKKTNQQVTKSPTSKKSSTNNLLLKPFPENPITGGSSTRELINTKQNSFKNISTPSFTGIDRMIDSTISKKQLPPVDHI